MAGNPFPVQPIISKVTQYGLSATAGGWDPDGDSGTDKWQGSHGNVLNFNSCALTVSAENALAATLPYGHPFLASRDSGRLMPGTPLRVTMGALVFIKNFDDRAPESDPRLDVFNPYAFDNSLIRDFADVEVWMGE